jgi:signal transduction histidine kinase
MVVETIAVIALAAIPDRGDPGPLLAPIALQTALVFGTHRALKWIALQSCLIWLARTAYLADPQAWLYWALNVAAEIIAVGAVHVLRREAETATELTLLNSELRAAQALLADNAAAAERQRISRELHDAWGHDLTALSLQLEYAAHAPPELGRASVLEARDLAKSLLTKVRDVVGTLRKYDGHDVKPLLESLAANSPQLEVHLDIPVDLARQPSEAAQALLRAGQEIITNTLRHAGARNLWLELRVAEDGVCLEGRDDGAGAECFNLGHGLSGLRERFENLGGDIAFESNRGRGFRVTGRIPAQQPQP